MRVPSRVAERIKIYNLTKLENMTNISKLLKFFGYLVLFKKKEILWVLAKILWKTEIEHLP